MRTFSPISYPPGIHPRIKCGGFSLRALALIFTLIIALAVYYYLRMSPTTGSGGLVTSRMIDQLESNWNEDRKDSSKTLGVLKGYMALIANVEDMDTGVQDMLDFAQGDPNLANLPEVADLQESSDDIWKKSGNKLGIESSNSWNTILNRGLEVTRKVLSSQETDSGVKAAASVVQSKILIELKKVQEAVTAAGNAIQIESRSILAPMFRAEALFENQDYSGALKDLRTASDLLEQWSQNPPPWEIQIAAAKYNPTRATVNESNWGNQKSEIRRNMQDEISTRQVMLEALARIGK